MAAATRKEALQKGLVRFYTGKPCSHGHLSERYATTGACIECLRGTAPESVAFKIVCHVRDKEAVEAFVKGLADARTLAACTPLGRDEVAYFQMIANYRKLGCPDRDLPRYLGSFHLPDGVDP
jgi:hypothetical protein